MEGKAVVITDPVLLRGTDFKLSAQFRKGPFGVRGIDLFLATPVPNPRAFVQAGGRVGRYDEPCSRYRLSDTRAFHPESNQEIVTAVLKQHQESQQTQQRKREQKTQSKLTDMLNKQQPQSNKDNQEESKEPIASKEEAKKEEQGQMLAAPEEKVNEEQEVPE